MKKIIVTGILALTSVIYAQKNEIKELETAIQNKDFVKAKTASANAEALVANMDDKLKPKFYFLKAEAYYANGTGNMTDFDTALESIKTLADTEKQIGKGKYTTQAIEIKTNIMNALLKRANAYYESKNYIDAAKGFEKIYSLNPKDTVYLYNAAITAIQSKDYDMSLKHLVKLKDLKYTGIETNYYAVNRESNEVEQFNGKSTRDLAVNTLKTHKNPTDKKTESKRADIVKNIALIHIFRGENDKALAAIEEAKKENPNDYNLILSEANIYLQLKDEKKASELYKKALSMEPNNADLNYNVGVLAMNAKQYDDANTYFKKTIELQPDYADAYLNISFIEISKGNAINDQMNKLGNSRADNIKYEKLMEEKNALFLKSAKFLEDNYLSKFPNSKNIDVFKQLKNIYSAIGDTNKFKMYKAKVEALESSK